MEAEEEHAVQEQSRVAIEPEVQETAAKQTTLQPLEKVFVPLDVLRKVVDHMQEEQTGAKRHWREKMWLRAILQICLLTRTTLSQELDWQVRQVLVVHLYRRDLPRLVEVDPVYRNVHVVGYEIQVSLPVEQVAA
jgi:hypothetical protein